MTDILKRLNTVVTHAEHGVDPYWVEIAAKEIDRLRTLITAWVDSEDDLYGPTRATSVEWKRNDESCDALRKAVGR